MPVLRTPRIAKLYHSFAEPFDELERYSCCPIREIDEECPSSGSMLNQSLGHDSFHRNRNCQSRDFRAPLVQLRHLECFCR